MKKYLLSALLGVFGLVGAFANAETFTFEGEDWYNPSTFTTEGGIVSNFTTSSCSEDICEAYILDLDDEEICGSRTDQNTSLNGCDLSAGTYRFSVNNYYPWSSVSFSVGSSSGGGNVNEDNNSGILSGGTTAFSGIITSLGTAINEFIPYVVYIGIGLLGAIIGFVAIKRLLNRLRAKIFGTFSGGRRR